MIDIDGHEISLEGDRAVFLGSILEDRFLQFRNGGHTTHVRLTKEAFDALICLAGAEATGILPSQAASKQYQLEAIATWVVLEKDE